ncbi:MAG: helix-turn-helix transcriptional regulator [Leptolyngbyaceae cyanobacterium RU_5_1]|nr:helix-turn-helix transcriptional regulator [Leptolyngbyaceae cyanobacterium RU_5_1]
MSIHQMLENLIKQGVLIVAGLFVVDEKVLQRYAEVVKQARGKRSQREFSELLEVSQSTVHNWENAKNAPDLDGIEKIARIRGQLPEELITEIYGRQSETSLQERISLMSNRELAWLMTLIAQKLSE